MKNVIVNSNAARKNKISAILVVYNEEARIKKCLDSLRNAVDEIILVHDGPCTDSTLKIARRYTKKIFVRQRWGEAEPHRPFALAKCSGEWVLCIDADESLSPQLQKNLRKIVLSAEEEGVSGYAFYWPFYDKGVRITRGPLSHSYKLVLFKKDSTRISGVPHDWFKVSGKTKKIRFELDHKTEDNWSYGTFFKKNVPRAHVDARYRIAVNRNPHPAVWYLIKAPIWFFLYLLYSFFRCRLFLNGRLGFRIAVETGLYNFFLYYHVFKIKLGRTFK